jgi:hypothetical protein
MPDEAAKCEKVATALLGDVSQRITPGVALINAAIIRLSYTYSGSSTAVRLEKEACEGTTALYNALDVSLTAGH